jgi:hypothetical protein
LQLQAQRQQLLLPLLPVLQLPPAGQPVLPAVAPQLLPVLLQLARWVCLAEATTYLAMAQCSQLPSLLLLLLTRRDELRCLQSWALVLPTQQQVQGSLAPHCLQALLQLLRLPPPH